MRCIGLFQAVKLLKENNVIFDNAYENKFFNKNYFGDIISYSKGIHIYFNNGFSENIAYYTPETQCLIIFGTARVDGTPQENRMNVDINFTSEVIL
jgi:hypothetical protein